MSEDKNYFQTLMDIDVWEDVEEKGGFDYLAWHKAVKHLKTAFPSSTWRVVKHDGLPYLRTDIGYFVEVEVTVDGVTQNEILPVLDKRNNTLTDDCINPISDPKRKNPILKANKEPFMGVLADDVNTSIKRCFVKACALHGLGLNIYMQENKPADREKSSKKKASMQIDQNQIDTIKGYYKINGASKAIEDILQRTPNKKLEELTQLDAVKTIHHLETKYKTDHPLDG